MFRRLFIFSLAGGLAVASPPLGHSAVAHDDTSMEAGRAVTAPVTLVSRTPKTVSEADLTAAEGGATAGTVSGDKNDKKTLSFSATDIRLVVRTGPEDDMLSFRIAGLRNPTLVVPAGTTLHILFANTDGDMPHDFRISPQRPPFPLAPLLESAVGSSRLPHEEDETYSGEELVLKATATGNFTYFCSLKGHAKSGMWGAIAIGVAPDAKLQNNTAPASHDEHASHEGHDHRDMAGMDMHGAGMSEHGDAPHDDMAHSGMPGIGAHMNMNTMPSTVDLNAPMGRESSGTAWAPESSPMYMKMKMRGKSMLMLHGTAFPRYTHIGSSRDVSVGGKGNNSRFDAPTMFMGMYSKPLSEKSQIGVRLMTSLDPIIERGYGYPLLYQSGEEYRGQPIHDRQHPHDLISEMSVTYSRRVGANKSAYLYAGYPGEPALGPPTFMHRVSAMDNPDAPISHHWQDSTHITWGVATLGYSMRRWKLEASAFKGEEPNENRYNFDAPRLDSFSGRLSWNPGPNWALQVSRGYLKRPEPSQPNVNQHRTTASVIYNRPLGADGNWSNSLVWGQDDNSDDGKSNSYLFETNLQRGANTVYARLEHVQKSGHELVLPPPDDQTLFGVNSYAVGYVRDLKRNKGIDMGLGVQATFGANPTALDTYYGSGSHNGVQIFLRLRPSRLRDDEMPMKH